MADIWHRNISCISEYISFYMVWKRVCVAEYPCKIYNRMVHDNCTDRNCEGISEFHGKYIGIYVKKIVFAIYMAFYMGSYVSVYIVSDSG